MRTALLLAAGLALGCGPKTSKPSGPPDWFPLVEGASWTYQGTFRDRSNVETRVAVEVNGGGAPAWVFLLEEDLNDSTQDTFTTMVGLGVYRRWGDTLQTADLAWMSDLKGLDSSHFQPMLVLPPVVGSSVVPETRSVDRAGGWTVEAIEDITVPAGSFDDCARVGLGQESKAWFCPDVGLVKWVFVTGRVEELTAWQIPGVSSGP